MLRRSLPLRRRPTQIVALHVQPPLKARGSRRYALLIDKRPGWRRQGGKMPLRIGQPDLKGKRTEAI